MSQNAPQPCTVEIKPKTQRDLAFVGIDNRIKVVEMSGRKIRRFLQKRAWEKIKNGGDVPEEWIDGGQVKMGICMMLGGKVIQEEDDFQVIFKDHRGEPLFYSIVKV